MSHEIEWPEIANRLKEAILEPNKIFELKTKELDKSPEKDKNDLENQQGKGRSK